MNLKVHIQTLSLYINKYIYLKFGEFVVNNKSYQTLGKELSEYKAFKCLDFSRSKTLKLQSNI